MSARLRIERVGPMTTIQDRGRHGLLARGISASGPMDAGARQRAANWAGAGDECAIEMTSAGLDLTVIEGEVRLGWDGGHFAVRLNEVELPWPGAIRAEQGDRLSITPGESGVYGYLCFGAQVDLQAVLGSRATSTRAKLGGINGRVLRRGDELALCGTGSVPRTPEPCTAEVGPFRMIWGIHAERFSREVRQRFTESSFRVTTAMDRMGVRLADDHKVFSGISILSLVSEPVLVGDIQILGDGTPIVLMRDHQPTGGYPRIGTIVTADRDRFAQMRSGELVEFAPVTVEHAHRLLRSRT